MTNSANNEGRVDEFHYVHLDTITLLPVTTPCFAGAREGDRMYQGCGKPRPMIILSENYRGWFQVLKLTTNRDKRVKVGRILGDKDSYTDGFVYYYPCELRTNAYDKRLRPEFLQHLLKEVTFRQVGFPPDQDADK
jgi:hypothetical protein